MRLYTAYGGADSGTSRIVYISMSHECLKTFFIWLNFGVCG